MVASTDIGTARRVQVRRSERPRSRTSVAGRSIRVGVLTVLLLAIVAPLLWMVWSSTRTNNVLTVRPPSFALDVATFDNYVRVLTTPRFLTYLGNSAIVATGSVILTIVVATLASYAFSRFTFRGRNIGLVLVLSVQMFPIVAILISLFDVFAKVHLLNTYPGLILASTTISLPFAIWFLTTFFDAVPRELDEAARVDGAGRMRTLWSVILPLTRPGLLAVGVYAFLQAWDDYVIALTLTTSDAMRTLPVGIALSFVGEFNFDYAGMMTISVVATLPVLIVYLFLQKHMIAGLTQGAVKG